MSYGASFHDNQPITWWKRLPIYAATIITGVLVFGLIASVLIASANGPVMSFAFSGPTFLSGALWQILTYPLIDFPSFFTLLGICCFFSWACEVEKYIGRKRFFQLVGGIILGEALTCLLWWWTFRIPATAYSSYHLTAALLISFATLYPNVEYLFGWVPLKWFAFASFILGSLMYFPSHRWDRLSQLWVACGIGFGFIRWVQRGGEISFPKFRMPNLQKRPKLRVLPTPKEGIAHHETEPDETTTEMDILLDKIAKSGIDSLSSKERARLEKAREELLKRESSR
jgi:hypothetical protein